MTSLLPLKTRMIAEVFQTPRRVIGHRISGMLAGQDLPGRFDFTAIRPQTRILIVSLACLIGVTILATGGAIVSIEMSASRAPDRLGEQTRVATALSIRGESESVVTRPLFSRHRQNALPVPVAPIASPPPAVLDRNLVLKGVFMNDVFAKAFLTSTQNPLGIWVQAHDEISGWRVVRVQADRVTLESLGDTLLIQLSINGRTQ